jgi:hypothetical protein
MKSASATGANAHPVTLGMYTALSLLSAAPTPRGYSRVMAAGAHHLVIDSRGAAVAEFWCSVLDQPILSCSDDEVIVGADLQACPG